MSTRNKRVILLALAIVLLGIIAIVSTTIPSNTGGLRDVINRDDAHYKTIVIQTMTAQAGK